MGCPSMGVLGRVGLRLAGGVCPGECLPGGVGFSACWDAPQAGTPWTEWQTGVKTLPCRNFAADGNKKFRLKTWIESRSISCVLCVFQHATRRWRYRSYRLSGTESGSRASVRGSSPPPPASNSTTSARATWTRAPGRPASGPAPCRSTKQPDQPGLIKETMLWFDFFADSAKCWQIDVFVSFWQS